jgi:hypothetical protein
LVTTEGCDDSSLVGESDLVLGGGREKALKDGDGGVEDDGAFNTSLDAGLDFAVVNQVGADALNVGGRRGLEVVRAQESAQLVGLGLYRRLMWQSLNKNTRRTTYNSQSGGLGIGPSVCLGILVVVVAITVASDDDNTEDFWQQHCRVTGWFWGWEENKWWGAKTAPLGVFMALEAMVRG